MGKPEKTKKTTEADKIYEKASKLRKEGNMEEAIELYQQVLEMKPNKIGAYYYTGLCYDELGYLDDALENFKIYKDRAKDPEKKEKAKQIIERLTREIEEELQRQEEIKQQREERYREFLEVKWINGVVKIPTLKNVRERLKIDEERAREIEDQVKIHIEYTIKKEKQLLKEIKPEEIARIKEKSWDKEEDSQENEVREEAKRNYYLAVEMAWSDATADEYENSYLGKMRRITGVTEKEALEIEKEIKEKLKKKIQEAKQELVQEEKRFRAENKLKEIAGDIEIHNKPSARQSLLEVRLSEVQEARRREEEAKKLLEESLKQKEIVAKKYEEEVETFWETSKLTEDSYTTLRKKRALLGLSDREALEIEKSIEIKRKKFLEEEEQQRQKRELAKQISPEEELLKSEQLIPLTLVSNLKKTVAQGPNSFLITREFQESALEELRAFIILGQGVGQFKEETENISTLAVKSLGKYLTENRYDFTLDAEKSRSLLKDFIQKSINQVFEKADDEELPLVKINIIVIIFIHNKYLIGNLGNTRCYIVNEHQIRQITRDQYTRTIIGEEIKEFINGSTKIKPAIFPLGEENFFDLPVDEIIFLCSGTFVDIIGTEEIKRQLNETQTVQEACEGLANIAYFIKEGTEDIGISTVEAGTMTRVPSAPPIIPFDGPSSLAKPSKKSLFTKIKKFFKQF